MENGVAKLDNLAAYEEQSLYADLDSGHSWAYGEMQYSVDGATWGVYNEESGITLGEATVEDIQIRYCGTAREMGDEIIYKYANFF